jgi:hypothetical protein
MCLLDTGSEDSNWCRRTSFFIGSDFPEVFKSFQFIANQSHCSTSVENCVLDILRHSILILYITHGIT